MFWVQFKAVDKELGFKGQLNPYQINPTTTVKAIIAFIFNSFSISSVQKYIPSHTVVAKKYKINQI